MAPGRQFRVSPLQAWARTLVGALRAGGVTDVVVSPGSRSTPFVLAAIEREELRLVDIVDERSAGFYALGLARATGCPVALLCTSGTAPAHYLPAVIEAREENVPLVVVSADRPIERTDCRAPQTIDQAHLFGGHVLDFVDLGNPELTGQDGAEDGQGHLVPRALRAVARRVASAVFRSRGPEPGPVHINARARKPLQPAPDDGNAGESPPTASHAPQAPAPQVFSASRSPSPAGIEQIAQALRSARRPLVVAGAAPFGPRSQRYDSATHAGPGSSPSAPMRRKPSDEVLRLVHSLGLPLYADCTSQIRFSRAASALARSEDTERGALLVDGLGCAFGVGSFWSKPELWPDLVLQLGNPPIVTAYERLLEASACRHVVIAEAGWPDPVSTCSLMIQGDIGRSCELLREALDEHVRAPRTWVERLRQLDGLVERAMRENRSALSSSGVLGEGEVAEAIVERAPAGTLLALGNSLPIRLVDTYLRAGTAELDVWSQRGVNGIDGLISGFAGSVVGASSWSSPPAAAIALVGDVSLKHDLGGLELVSALRDLPVVIVVINNGGGRIFEQLPIRDLDLSAAAMAHWTTPHERSFRHACEHFGLGYSRVESREQLDDTLVRTLAEPRATVVEVASEAGLAEMERQALLSRIEESMKLLGESR